MGSSPIRVEHPSDGVALVVLDRPDRLNALDAELFAALPQTFERVGADPDVRVVVLTGAGGAFSAGADLQHHGITATDIDGHRAWMREVQGGPLAVYRLAQPTVAAVHGVAAGGGLGLALACDIRIASPEAVFTTAFIRIGLAPDFGVSKLLAATVGESRAMEWLLTSRRVDAAEAERAGLVARVEPDALKAGLELAGEIAAMPAEAIKATKHAVRSAAVLDYEAATQTLEPDIQAALIHAARLRPQGT